MIKPDYTAIMRPKVSDVYDADSFKKSCVLDLGFGVLLYPKGHRLYGVDTPEKRPKKTCKTCGTERPPESLQAEKDAAKAATDMVKDIVKRCDHIVVYLKGSDRGLEKYGRTLGEWIAVMPNGERIDIGKRLVRDGHAYTYYGGTKKCRFCA